MEPPEALCVEGGQDHLLLRVSVELLLLAPLHRLNFCVFYERLVPLLDMPVPPLESDVTLCVSASVRHPARRDRRGVAGDFIRP
jgi:hypothetical protein